MFGFLKRSNLNLPRNASENFKTFYGNYISDGDLQRVIHDGLDERIFAKLTREELAEAERMMLEKLPGGDSRPAIGLGIIRSQKAAAPIRKLLAKDKKPAYAHALWRIEGDPQVIKDIVAMIQNNRLDSSQRIDAVRALSEMPSEASRQSLMDTLQKNSEYLIRYHSFTSLLMLYGYAWKAASDETGSVAPQISRMLNDPAAAKTVFNRLEELTQGRQLKNS